MGAGGKLSEEARGQVSAFRGEGSGTEGVMTAEERAEARRGLGLPVEGVVAANLNRPFKLEPRLFSTWLRLLNASAHARADAGRVLHLWMLDWPEALAARRNLLRAAGDLAPRLLFTPLLPFEVSAPAPRPPPPALTLLLLRV